MPESKDWTKEELEKEYIDTMTAVTIPVDVTLKGKQQILGLTEMEKILSEAKMISLGDCGCRKRVKMCDAPLNVCIELNGNAEDMIERGMAKQVSLEEALDALKRSHDAGLVHIAYTFKDSEKPDIICSCCSCCCHSMSALVRFGMAKAVVSSNCIAVHNPETCIDCGVCVERCQFKARTLENGKLVFNATRCFGCGVCTSTCPTQSTSLVKRN